VFWVRARLSRRRDSSGRAHSRRAGRRGPEGHREAEVPDRGWPLTPRPASTSSAGATTFGCPFGAQTPVNSRETTGNRKTTLRPWNVLICSEIAASTGTTCTACHAEGREFEPLQPLPRASLHRTSHDSAALARCTGAMPGSSQQNIGPQMDPATDPCNLTELRETAKPPRLRRFREVGATGFEPATFRPPAECGAQHTRALADVPVDPGVGLVEFVGDLAVRVAARPHPQRRPLIIGGPTREFVHNVCGRLN
jgi:hypothetical protein